MAALQKGCKQYFRILFRALCCQMARGVQLIHFVRYNAYDIEDINVADLIEYRHASKDDLQAIGTVFLAAFPESVQFYVGRAIPPTVLADLFSICLAAEPEAFFVALVNGQVAGYVFAPAHFSRLTGTALRHGSLPRMAWRWISGQYGLGLHPVFVAARNWLSLLQEAQHKALSSDARILSIAVDPQFQGHGLGQGLMQRAMAYLASQGVARVRLEVRPDNPAAVHLYEKYGFTTRGQTRDLQGPWVIMLKDMEQDSRA